MTRGHTLDELIAELTALYSQARTNWVRAAEDVHPQLKGLGLLMLQMIARRQPITATEIGSILDMNKAAVSRQLSRLREMNMVSCVDSAEDRRMTLITITQVGLDLLDELRGRSADNYRERFADWPESDLEQLLTLLHRFNAA